MNRSIVLFALVLAGCAGGIEGAFKQCVRGDPGKSAPAAPAVVAAGCAVAAGEMGRARVLRADPADAGQVASTIDELIAVVETLKASDGMWANTETMVARQDMIRAIAGRVRTVFMGIWTRDLGLKGAAQGVGRVALGSAVMRDIAGLAARVEADEIDQARAFDILLDRLRWQRASIAPLINRPRFVPTPAVVPTQ